MSPQRPEFRITPPRRAAGIVGLLEQATITLQTVDGRDKLNAVELQQIAEAFSEFRGELARAREMVHGSDA